jgi:hypothetical protein
MKNKGFLKVAGAIALSVAIFLAGMNFAPLLVNAQNYPGTIPSALPNYRYKAMVFTATSQTLTQAIGGVATATVSISGAATSCILQIFASNDGGANYFAIPYFAGVYTSNVPVVVTGAAFPTYTNTPVLYWVSLAGFTNFKIVSSGTFTGASCTVQVTASSNPFVIT